MRNVLLIIIVPDATKIMRLTEGRGVDVAIEALGTQQTFDVEIVADRGIHARVDSQEWEKICRTMETAFKHAYYEAGVVCGKKCSTRCCVTA